VAEGHGELQRQRGKRQPSAQSLPCPSNSHPCPLAGRPSRRPNPNML
jgi:hypothetical protein